MEAVATLKDIFEQVKNKIVSGEVQDNIVDFLEKIKATVAAKIAAASPAVKAILEKVDAAVQDVIAKARPALNLERDFLLIFLMPLLPRLVSSKTASLVTISLKTC